MIQVLVQIATHAAALLLYPGLVATVLFGAAVETIWVRVSDGRWVLPDVRWRRPSAVLSTLAIASMLAAVQMSSPFHPVPSERRNLLIPAGTLGVPLLARLSLRAALLAGPRLV